MTVFRDAIVPGSLRTETHTWTWSRVTVRCGRCGSEFDAGADNKTARCKKCNRTCRLDQAAQAGPNVVPLRSRRRGEAPRPATA